MPRTSFTPAMVLSWFIKYWPVLRAFSTRFFLLHNIQHGDGGGTGQVISTKGGAQQSVLCLVTGLIKTAATGKPLPIPLATVIKSG